MATQTYITDLQAMNSTTVQVQHNNQNTAASVTKSTAGGTIHQTTGQKMAQATTIIQPAQAHSGQQFIVTTSSVSDGVESGQDAITLQGGQTVYPAHVQYVDGSDPSIYASANGQMHNYQDYGQNAMYTPVSGTYYHTAGQVASGMVPVGSTVQTVQGQIIQQGSGTYLIQSGTMDGEGTPLTHTTRASPATVQWLLDNYETAEGVSLPRSTLYYHYLRHCQEQNLDPMNPASFGKLIRSVFLGLRTRRLGTRGNSKYHYYGIRIKANSPLNQFTDDQTMAMRQQPMYQSKKLTNCKMEGDGDSIGQGSNTSGTQEPTQPQNQHHQFLGDASAAIPNFEDIDTSAEPLPEGVTPADVRTFQKIYREHAEAVLDVVVNLQFSLIEALWQGFWRNQPEQNIAESEFEKRLPRDKLFILCKYEPVRKYVKRSDYAFYQALVEVLIPDVLRPIPSSLTQAIRNFAKSLENWLKGAMAVVPEEMVKTKVGAVSAFAQTLRRYTSLNHLAQAARAVLQNTSQINQMLTDLNRVDFLNVQEQASWVCQCDDSVVQQLQEDFKKTLKQQNSLEQWAVWLESVVNQVLQPHEGSTNFPKAARQFLLKWSFYSSMVIRDLTLRSAASFGSFHLIRLLYDEYMFYLVEHKVARATGETPIAVMGEVRQFIDLSSAIAMSTLECEKPPTPPAKNPVTMAPVRSMEHKTVMLVTSIAGTGSSSTPGTISVRPTSNGIGGNNVNMTNSNTSTVVVLSANTTAGSGTGTNTITGSSGSTPTAVTVRTASSGGPNAKTHTILVMPVPSTGAGEGSTIKRLKTE
ncbi:DNA-binding protein RFX2-like isoform X2 [Gigantopelta aegis]|uniref:DNA-binding protein RFX2-like isoform X2 n=1 Tax=Gigantopelta aegis TaxID=1735272 RepID=UPI001B88B58E|nr:DNA-binding protein RFX2-like isoform X2 [Gigantopelta aegis]